MLGGGILSATGFLELSPAVQDGFPGAQHLLRPVIFIIQTLLMTQILVGCISRGRVIIILLSPIGQLLLLADVRLFLPDGHLHPSFLLLIIILC